ncbi:hypothetical protein D9M68_490660 [compost metagenome]
MVVHHVGEEVGGQAVGLHQDLHIHAIPRDFHIATEHVRHHADAFARHLHAHHMGFASGDTLVGLLPGKVHAVAVVARGFLALGLLGAQLVQALGGAEAGEGMTLVHQLLGILLVDLATLALAIRAVGATDVRALIPFDAEPAQGVIDLLLGLAGRAQLIGVFDPQDELTAVLARETQVEQGDVGGAHVRVASGRRRDTGTDGGHGFSRNSGSIKGAILSGWPPRAPASVLPAPAGCASGSRGRP